MKDNYDILKIRSGSESEFRKLINCTLDKTFRFVFRLVADEEDAKDILQDSYVKVWEKRKSLREDVPADAFIMRIAINKGYDLLRKRSRHREENADNEVLQYIISDDEADKALNNKDLALAIESLSEWLSPAQKLVFTLVEMEQLDHDEVAQITGMKKDSIKSNLRHARKNMEDKLRKYLEEYK
ncbi:MAG: RNA polymerase sigma factor [Bacteroidales bacterium]|nr:RNA polymerase sigma factor [Bacteroidales bacterium]